MTRCTTLTAVNDKQRPTNDIRLCLHDKKYWRACRSPFRVIVGTMVDHCAVSNIAFSPNIDIRERTD